MTAPVTRFLVCWGMLASCRDGAARKQLRLDRSVADGFGIEMPLPTMRVINGGDRPYMHLGAFPSQAGREIEKVSLATRFPTPDSNPRQPVSGSSALVL